MAFFASIPQESFDEALSEMLRKNKQLRPVIDWKSLDWEWGVDVLILGEYRQAYIGQSSSHSASGSRQLVADFGIPATPSV